MKTILKCVLLLSIQNATAQTLKYRVDLIAASATNVAESQNNVMQYRLLNGLQLHGILSKHIVGNIGGTFTANKLNDKSLNTANVYNGKIDLRESEINTGIRLYKNISTPKVLKPYLNLNLNFSNFSLKGKYDGGIGGLGFAQNIEKINLGISYGLGVDCNLSKRFVLGFYSGFQKSLYEKQSALPSKFHSFTTSDIKVGYKFGAKPKIKRLKTELK